MTDKPTRTLTFGAVGWNDPRLVEALYPEDAPPEWRLSCYTSHFDTVLVPEADWGEADPRGRRRLARGTAVPVLVLPAVGRGAR
jgi:hypothetical protein